MKNFRLVFLFGAISLLVSCNSARNLHEQLHALFDEEWNFRLAEEPVFATSTGNHQYDDRLPQVTMDALTRRAEFWRNVLGRLEKFDRASLSHDDQINYDIFKLRLEDNLASFEHKAYLIPFTVDDGFHISFARLPNQAPRATVQDYENYLERLRAFPEYVAQHIELLKEGIKIGMTMPQVVLQGYEVTMATHIVDDPAKSVFYAPFAKFPAAMPENEKSRLKQAGEAAIRQAIVPGYQTLLDFFTKEYIPKARQTIGAADLPNGREYYAQRVRHFTTLDLGVEEIHQLGLSEVQRIRGEMMEIIKQVGFKGDFAAFLKFLRTDPQFYAKTPEELLKEASYIAKRMDAKLPSLFKTLPRLPYGVQAVPEHLAPKYTGGRYVGPALGSTEPGYYWVNTYALENRPLYVLESLTLHEAVPGHHLQNALAREMEGLPNFRRFTYLSAFGEGWGLYSERLGLEAGFYTNPYSNFGRLTYEMWRACRLVVDTGIHAKGWTREQAMEYLASNTALSLHEVRTETDRYISWPGQALAYKIGELKIRELRRKAEEALNEKFDLREFHDVVLRNGAIPLTTLEGEVQAYIQSRLSN
ncbi:MAG: DUF885 domain-containing protein [candidate division KSB1 bacterium]|nr:DUF885 domain-containing protein [candidate division KSB1 bacterium]MDZ7366445.1 DUF885 domain-containing protein [candidate division KSB1 bacterium]MDZ7404593.1 DUF885 domain-containing protein [candidate division KSB1 bacterium]